MKKAIYLTILIIISVLGLAACTEKPPIDLKPIELETEAGSSETRVRFDTEGHKASVELVNAPTGVQLVRDSSKATSGLALGACPLDDGCKLKVAEGVLAGKYNIRLKVHLIDLDKDVFTQLTLIVNVAISLNTTQVVIAPGENYMFIASVAGSKDKTVTWSATGGEIDSSGKFTAGKIPGKYKVVATTVSKPVKSATAQVEIKKTRLQVTVNPPNAAVQIYDNNNKKVAEFVGNKEYDNFKPGQYTIKAKLEGYKDFQKSYLVKAGKVNSISIKLVISTGIRFDVSPEDANIAVEGPNGYIKSLKGDSLIGGLKPGSYKLKISAAGYRTYVSQINIAKDVIKDIKVALEKKIGLDLKPKLRLGVSVNQPVGTVMTVKIGVDGYKKNLDIFSLKAYWKKPGQEKFGIRTKYYFDEDRGLIELLLPGLGEGENILKLVVDEEDVIKEDDEENNVLLQSFFGGDQSSNKPPSVIINATPKTGKKPLSVSFSAKASDQDGKIVAYEWDFDGDGKTDATTKVSAKHIYSNDGVYHATVKVKDDKGAYGSDDVVITVGNPPKETGSLQIDVAPNDAKVTVTGPKSFNQSFVGDKTLNNLNVGTYNIEVKKNGYATRSLAKSVVAGKTAKAIIKLTPVSGVDLKPKIKIGVSTTQPVGTVMTVKVGVDGYVTGMDIFSLQAYWKKAGETSFSERAKFYYDEDRGWIELLLPGLSEGENILKLVADSKNDIAEDNESNNTLEQIFVGTGSHQNSAPTVSLAAKPSSGTFPLTVSFVASASDTDGKIVKYEWDFNGDNQVDKVGSATENYIYKDNGDYVAKVTVTDNEGAKASARMAIHVTVPSDGIKPVVAWLTPKQNEVITSVAQLKVSVESAEDAVVSYKVGSKTLAQDLLAPYEYAWSPNVGDNGTKTIIAKACDVDGCSEASLNVGVDIVDRAKWVKNLPYSAAASPIARGDAIYGGMNVGLIYKLLEDGTLWTTEKFLPAAISNKIEIDRENNLAYVHSQTGYLYAVSLTSGALVWSQHVGINYGTYSAPSPVLVDGLVYVAGGAHNNCMGIYDSGGTLVNPELLCFDGWLVPTPVTKDGYLYLMERVSSSKSKLHKITDTAEVVASSANMLMALEANTLSVDEDAVLAASTFRTITKFNTSDLSTSTLNTGLLHKASVLPTPNCYVSNVNSALSCLDKGTGEAKWSYAFGLYPLVTVAYDAQRAKIYAASFDGKVVALEEATGALSWSYDLNDLDTSGGVRSTPVILGDTLIIVRDKAVVGLSLNY